MLISQEKTWLLAATTGSAINSGNPSTFPFDLSADALAGFIGIDFSAGTVKDSDIILVFEDDPLYGEVNPSTYLDRLSIVGVGCMPQVSFAATGAYAVLAWSEDNTQIYLKNLQLLRSAANSLLSNCACFDGSSQIVNIENCIFKTTAGTLDGPIFKIGQTNAIIDLKHLLIQGAITLNASGSVCIINGDGIVENPIVTGVSATDYETIGTLFGCDKRQLIQNGIFKFSSSLTRTNEVTVVKATGGQTFKDCVFSASLSNDSGGDLVLADGPNNTFIRCNFDKASTSAGTLNALKLYDSDTVVTLIDCTIDPDLIDNAVGGTVNRIDTARLENATKTMVNKSTYDKSTGVMTVYDDDGTTPILTLTMSDADSTETRTPS